MLDRYLISGQLDSRVHPSFFIRVGEKVGEKVSARRSLNTGA
ncbi:hypothetical protein I543_1405 [Mycobacteroides abscessus 21]|uniref:Uncharacterized protein n=1 Tax=Mycobacteroides abscessus 21 TaxID=1299324 RepID=A0A829PYH4_9MYCO|nr:hypothetical protein I543_1405 [Mycobacteroides abscessus 21]